MLYQFKKLLFASDNDFVLWHIANSDDNKFIEKIITDKKLKLTVKNHAVSLNAFAYQAFDPSRTASVSKLHSVMFSFGLAKKVRVGRAQYESFCALEKEISEKTKKPKRY